LKKKSFYGRPKPLSPRQKAKVLFGMQDFEVIHRSGTEAGLLGIYNFPGAVYATDSNRSNDEGVMGAGFYRLDENRRGCSGCQLGGGKEENSSN